MTTEGPPYRSLAGRAGGPILALLILAAVAQAMAYLVPMLLRDDVFAGDAAQHTWWLARYADPTLFPNDRIADYYAQPAYAPAGYRAYFRLLVPHADPQHLAEALAAALAVAAIGLAAWLGGLIGKKTGAAVGAAVVTLCHVEKLVEGGFPRSFAIVLLLAGMIALVRRRWAVLGGVLVASTLFYAPAVLNLVPAIAIVVGLGLRRFRRLPRGFGWMTVLGLVAIAVIAQTYLKPLPAEIGRWYTRAEARQMPERLAHGRTTFFRPWNVLYFSSTVGGLGLTPKQTLAAVALLALTVLWRPRLIGPEAGALLAAALAMWALAHAMLFKLYLPSRYTMYALPVFAVMWAAGVSREINLIVLARVTRMGPSLRRVLVAVACMVIAAAFVRAGRTAVAMRDQPGRLAQSPGLDAVLPTLAALPTNTLIAAHPEDANAIPLRCRRSVLVNTETSIAFHTGYYTEMSRRLSATFDLLYATDWPTVDAIAAREHVGVFVLDTTRLARPDERPYYEPFRTANLDRIAAGRSGGFALLSPPPDRVLFKSGDWVALRVGGGTP